MHKPKLLYYSILKYQDDTLAQIRGLFDVIELPDPSADTDQILREIDVALAPLGFFFGPGKIDRCPRLKAIGSNTTGHPHIDVDHARARGVKVVTLKHEQEFLAGITPTAELAWGLIIALTRNIVPASASTLDSKWNRRLFPGRRMLSRMSIGIVGLGRLGHKVAQYALTFGMRVGYFDPFVSSGGPGLNRASSLQELVSENDIVSVHVPHENATEGMFDAEIFEAFRTGAFFINTARGELVDHEALLQALSSGHLAGAAVDVFEGEFAPDFQKHFKYHPLLSYAKSNENLIITPHIGGSTLDAWSETEKHTIRLLTSVLEKPAVADSQINICDGLCWAIITARGGSKSIPLKNLVLLNGTPLIDYAIGVAERCTDIARTVCSTDSEEIADHCLKAGIEVDRRPDALAADHVATVDVLMEFMERQAAAGAVLPEFLVLLEPTSPFVAPACIAECIAKLKVDPSADSAQTVTRVASNSHAYNQRFHDRNGSNFLFTHERKSSVNKQSKPDFFIHGNVRVMRTESLMHNRNIFGKRSLPIEIPKVFAMDVDGQEDLLIAEALIAAGLLDELELGR